MFNATISYVLIQDGVKTENLAYGTYQQVGNLHRVVFSLENEGNVSEHTYVAIDNTTFKIMVKGDTEYSLTVSQNKTSNAVLKSGGVEFPFSVNTTKCKVNANNLGMQITSKYTMVAFGQNIENKLTMKVDILGEVKC